MSEMHLWSSKQWRDRNDRIVPELRATGVQQPNTLILTTTGRKSGQPHVTPLVFLADGDRFVVFASKGGSAKNPAWFHNLGATPAVTVEANGETFAAIASIAQPQERDRLYALQVERMPGFGEYQNIATRTIPVVILQRA